MLKIDEKVLTTEYRTGIMAWLGLAWLGLAWLGLAWLGVCDKCNPLSRNLLFNIKHQKRVKFYDV